MARAAQATRAIFLCEGFFVLPFKNEVTNLAQHERRFASFGANCGSNLSHCAEQMKKRLSKYTPRGYKLSVRRSPTGKGLFAEEDIPKGVCIIEYTGRVVSEKEAEEDGGKYLFEVSARKTIDGNIPTNRARFINHSCRPNCEASGPSGKVFIFSRKRIKAGTELTYNYGKEYFDKFIKPKGCKCEKHRHV